MKMTKNQKWTLASTSAGNGLLETDSSFISFAMTPIIAEMHISGAEGGMMITANDIGMLIGALIFGMLADIFGRVRVLTYTIFLAAIATTGMYFAHGIFFIYVMRFIEGLGDGGEYGAGVTLIAENFKHHKIGTLESVANSIGELGSILSALIAAVVIPLWGWRTMFLFGLIPVALAFITRKNLNENPDFLKNVRERRLHHHHRIPNLKRLFETPKIAWQTIAIMIMAMVEEAGYDGLLSWLPSMMQKQLHVSVTDSSLWTIATVIGVGAGAIAFGKLMDAKGARFAFTTFFIASAISVYAIPMSFNAITLIIAATIVGFFVTATYSGYGVVISRLYPMDIRATANSFIENMGTLFGGFAPMAIGFMMQYSSIKMIMLMLSLMFILSLVVMLSIPNLKKLSIKEAAEKA
ncbi:MFS transporter [Acetilactobacillus jinshanensis]|nr:MFS transporter [Acetilactobacillus jinshanensis]URL61039.1 MFS transporter [uncultured bacterium]